MNVFTVGFFIIIYIIDRIVAKKFPKFYNRIQFPINITVSILVAIYCGFLVYGIYDVLKSSVSNGDKVFFVIFCGINISILVAIVVDVWVRWRKMKNIKNGC